MKRQVNLLFSTIHQLWAFAQEAKVSYMEIDTGRKILRCECSEAQIVLSKEKFGAQLLDPVKEA